MPTSSAVGRIAAILALVGAAIVVFLLLVGGGSPYTVTAKFENASQLVTGNTVNVAGVAAGSVKEIKLADDGQALVEIEVSDEYAPLPQGTHATVRSQSLSGIANRYVDLALPAAEPTPHGQTAGAATIDDGGTIEQVNTTSEVDLDAALQHPRRGDRRLPEVGDQGLRAAPTTASAPRPTRASTT